MTSSTQSAWFHFTWAAPSSVWIKCEWCRELIAVEYGASVADLSDKVDEHVCYDSEPS